MAVNPYTSQSISGYNSSPPPDDGTQTSANKVEWAKHKTKIGDPIKTLAEAINTETESSFNTLALPAVTSITTSATIAETHWHTGLLKTATGGKVNVPAPAGFENGWHAWVYNAGADELPIQATATSGLRGRYGQFASELLLPPGKGVFLLNTATVYIAHGWAHQIDDMEACVAAQMFN